ncbi:MAG TPA: hypothetical protein VL442_18120 [Mucilaginibacter sp.]|jgi:hypothetical protein|nr:hypothetical protein [Mucilaginibacter sp.]
MKTYLIILISICALFNKASGQSSSAAIDTLVKYKVISPKDIPIIKGEFKYRYEASDQVVLLGGIENILLQKRFHVDPHKTGLMYNYRYDNTTPAVQDSINKSLRQLLQNINKAGLLTNKVYTSTLAEIDSGHYVDQLQMIPHLVEMSSRLEWMAPSKLLPIVEGLHSNGTIRDSSFLQLQSDIRNGKIESSFQLNDYFKLDRTFDRTKYPEDSTIWIEAYLRKVSSILPELNFSNYSCTIEPDSGSGLKLAHQVKVKISLTCNRRVYKYSTIAEQFKDREGKLRLLEIGPEFVYRIFNKVLADKHSSFRLNNISFSHAGKEEDHLKYFAVIALRGAQTELFMNRPYLSYMLLAMENYDNNFTSGRIDSAISEWQRMGLFAHLSQTEIDKGIDDAETAERYSINSLLENFPKVVCSTHPTGIFPKHPYADFLKRLAATTHGEFKPTKVTESKAKGGTKLQYVSNGKVHSQMFKWQILELDPKFASFLKHLRIENNLSGDFYWLPGGFSVIYLTKQQYTYALAHKSLDLK